MAITNTYFVIAIFIYCNINKFNIFCNFTIIIDYL